MLADLYDRRQATFVSKSEINNGKTRVTCGVNAGQEAIEANLPAIGITDLPNHRYRSQGKIGI